MAEVERVVGVINLNGVHGEGKYTLVSLCDLDYLSQYTWFVTTEGYVSATIAGEKDYRMHRLIMGLDARRTEDIEVDHKNHNRLDNTRSNLRVVDRSQNMRNRSKYQTMNGKQTSSQFKGVYWDKEAEKWKAQIGVNKKQYNLGRFDDEIEAALAYDRKCRELHGQYGILNFPDPVVQMITINYNYYSGPPQTQ